MGEPVYAAELWCHVRIFSEVTGSPLYLACKAAGMTWSRLDASATRGSWIARDRAQAVYDFIADNASKRWCSRRRLFVERGD